MLIGVGILFGLIFIYKVFMEIMIRRYIASQSRVVTVSAMKVDFAPWQSQFKAIGSLRAIKGVNVTSGLAGNVDTIAFTPGSTVVEGALLVQLNIDSDVALLHSLEATTDLAKITYKRDQGQFAIKAISKEVLDTDAANLKNYQAQVAQQEAIIAKKIIRAPFSGRLGVSAVNPGQYINPGDKVVSLQQLDPIYADFYVPQQALEQLRVGQKVFLSSDSFPKKKFTGTITTIDPIVDTATRNVQVEATISNPQLELLPGMFVSIIVETAEPKHFLTLPQTAVTFNPYGSVVFIIKPKGTDKKDKDKKVVHQIFVKTGETRGDQVIILDGLKQNDEVVTSGQLKLKNDTEVTIDNSVAPINNPDSILLNDH